MPVIPNFPQFRSVDLNIKKEIDDITRADDIYSDFNFTSIYCWNTTGHAKCSLLYNNLVLELPDYTNEGNILSIFGDNNIGLAISDLLIYGQKQHVDELQLVPELTISKLSAAEKSKLYLEEDRDSFDYIFNVNEHVLLEGSNYQQERKLLRRFERQYGQQITVKHLNQITSQDTTDLQTVLSKWKESPNMNEQEFVAIERCLGAFSELGLELILVYIAGKPVSFAINEYTGMQGVAHFEKSLLEYDNISHFIKHQSMLQFKKHGCASANYEQDLGIPGLRTMKLRYKPNKMLRKYSVKLRT